MNYQIARMLDNKHTCQECEYFNSMPEECNYPKAEDKACDDFVSKYED